MDPVTKKIFVQKEGLPENMPVGGLEALASISMLAEPRIPIRALDKKAVDDYPLRQIQPGWETENDYIELELWAYDPCSFAQHCYVDIVSLYASLQNENDERIEKAMEEGIREYAW